MEYDDEKILAEYVCQHYSSLLTDFESRVLKAILWRQQAATVSHEKQRELMLKRFGEVGTAEIDSELAEDPIVFKKKVCKRLLQQHQNEIFINRCKQCGKVVRTPEAKQCLWCGFDWHRK